MPSIPSPQRDTEDFKPIEKKSKKSENWYFIPTQIHKPKKNT